MNFAFLYSSFLCFTTAIEKWDTEISVLLFFSMWFFIFCGCFRNQIAKLFYKIKKVKDYE